MIMALIDEFLRLEDELCADLMSLTFDDPIKYVYNPLIYARETHQLYVTRYLSPTVKTLFLGMNPGPFGMVQTGVPFGS